LRQREAAGLADENEHWKFSRRIKTAIDPTKAKANKFSEEVDWILGRRTVRVLCAVALFAIVVALLLVLLDLYINPTKPGDKKDLVLAMAQILAGTALLSGLYFTWRTLQVNREGQITERFTRAIEQLGATNDDKSKNLELRLGGIYALERISKESKDDHWTIMEVLTAYVRQHASGRDASVEKPKEDSLLLLRGEFRPTPRFPALEIQAIMTVIRRRNRSLGCYGEPEALDLHWTYLTRANLKKANLSKADLRKADLVGANLVGANLVGADLRGAVLEQANLREADLVKARGLTQVQIEWAIGDKETTKLPESLHPPELWSRSFEEQIKVVRGDQ
jgi:hypothetical protein